MKKSPPSFDGGAMIFDSLNGRCWSGRPSFSKAQHQGNNEIHKGDEHEKAPPFGFAQSYGYPHPDQDHDHDIDDGNQHEDDPPNGLLGDFKDVYDIQDGNEGPNQGLAKAPTQLLTDLGQGDGKDDVKE